MAQRIRRVFVDAGPVAWVSALAVIVALLSFDLLLGSIRPHVVGFREAIAWSVFYIGARPCCSA